MSPLTSTLLATLAITFLATSLLWGLATLRRDVSVIDIYWGLGFVVIAWYARSVNDPSTPRVGTVAALTTIWGVRLALHLVWRKRGEGEDRRYAAMREQHGDRFWWVSLFTVFWLQALILWFVTLPLQVAAVARDTTPLGWLDGVGFVLWLMGFVFEAAGDWQLARFKADPLNHGRVMDRGLWRYTRHPNYFGDTCVWWGLYLIAAAGGAVWTIASPLVMTFLLMKVSGVTLLEATITERRPAYAAYIRRTNAFFPGKPRPDRMP